MAYDRTKDPFANVTGIGLIAPATDMVAVVPSDTVDFTSYPREVWANGAGDIKVIPLKSAGAGTAVVITMGAAGPLPGRVRRVFATLTTVATMVAFY